MARRERHKDPTFPPKLKLVLGPHSCPARWYVATFYCRPPWWSLRRRAELSGVTWLVFVGGLATLLSFYTLPISLAIMLTGHIRDIQNVCEIRFHIHTMLATCIILVSKSCPIRQCFNVSNKTCIAPPAAHHWEILFGQSRFSQRQGVAPASLRSCFLCR